MSKLSEFYNDRWKLLHDDMSAEEFEAKWRGVRINRREVFADADAIFVMADAGILDLDDLYNSGGPEK